MSIMLPFTWGGLCPLLQVFASDMARGLVGSVGAGGMRFIRKSIVGLASVGNADRRVVVAAWIDEPIRSVTTLNIEQP